MDSANDQIVRRLLGALVNNLEQVIPAPAEGGGVVEAARAGVTPGERVAPIILVVIPGTEPFAGGRAEVMKWDSGSPQAAGAEQRHPNFDKFSFIEETQKNSAPRFCHMEPDRVCVNSGACESRGF